MCDIVVKRFTFAISSPDEFLLMMSHYTTIVETTNFRQIKSQTYVADICKEQLWKSATPLSEDVGFKKTKRLGIEA